MANTLLAGVAASEFTPKPGMVLQGHFSTNPSHSVLYPLEMRTIVFRSGRRTTCAIITLDVIGLERHVVDRIRQRIQRATGIPPANIMIACSHTHCAPPAISVLGMAPDADFMQRIEDRCVSTVSDATKSLEPVTLGLGCGAAYFNVNRRPLPGTFAMCVNDAAIVDRRARVLRIDRKTGLPLAVMFHFSCHPTSKSGSEGIISPDYPGVARAGIEKRLKCRALFMPGCFGNIRPRILDDNGNFGSATKEQIDALGGELANAVCDTAESIRTSRAVALSAREIRIKLAFGKTKKLKELREMTRQTTPLAQLLTGPWARRTLAQIRRKEMPKSEPTRMQSMQIGPLAIVTIPGEPVQEIGDAIEREYLSKIDARDLWPVGYTNDSVGYLCTKRQYDEGGYEPTAYPLYGRPAPFVGEMDTFLKGTRKLFNLGRKRSR